MRTQVSLNCIRKCGLIVCIRMYGTYFVRNRIASRLQHRSEAYKILIVQEDLTSVRLLERVCVCLCNEGPPRCCETGFPGLVL